MQTVLEQGSIDNPLTFDVGLIQLIFIPVCSLNTCNISVKLCQGFALQCFSFIRSWERGFGVCEDCTSHSIMCGLSHCVSTSLSVFCDVCLFSDDVLPPVCLLCLDVHMGNYYSYLILHSHAAWFRYGIVNPRRTCVQRGLL